MKLINKKRHIYRRLVKAVILVLFIMICIDNVTIHTTYTRVQIDDLPESFNDFRIVQVSDLHNNVYGINQSVLMDKIKACEPDIIVVTGDLIDRNTADVDNAMMFISRAVKIAPVYYVSGNHESGVPEKYIELVRRMTEAGVDVLQNESVTIFDDDDYIVIGGIADPAFDWYNPDVAIVDREIKQAFANVEDGKVKILLSHRPELIKTYSENDLDLVLTGHAHGGQVRLPFIGPLFSPSQGLFPKYTSGLYYEGRTAMYVSRGIGNGIAPLRFNDGPELAVIIIERAAD